MQPSESKLINTGPPEIGCNTLLKFKHRRTPEPHQKKELIEMSDEASGFCWISANSTVNNSGLTVQFTIF